MDAWRMTIVANAGKILPIFSNIFLLQVCLNKGGLISVFPCPKKVPNYHPDLNPDHYPPK